MFKASSVAIFNGTGSKKSFGSLVVGHFPQERKSQRLNVCDSDGAAIVAVVIAVVAVIAVVGVVIAIVVVAVVVVVTAAVLIVLIAVAVALVQILTGNKIINAAIKNIGDQGND